MNGTNLRGNFRRRPRSATRKPDYAARIAGGVALGSEDGRPGDWEGSATGSPNNRRPNGQGQQLRLAPSTTRSRCRARSFFGVTQTETGTTTFPGAGLPTSTRSAVTRSPVSRMKEAQGLGIRPKVNRRMGLPVVEFMMVATIAIRGADSQGRLRLSTTSAPRVPPDLYWRMRVNWPEPLD